MLINLVMEKEDPVSFSVTGIFVNYNLKVFLSIIFTNKVYKVQLFQQNQTSFLYG